MSIKRIESAYAYYLDKKMSSAQMAVLQALAYSANEKNDEACYPSLATIARLAHVTDRTATAACKALRDMGAIKWDSGGQSGGLNVANTYKFLFPQMKMPSRKEQYVSVLAGRTNEQSEGGEDTSLRFRSSFPTGTETPSGGVVKQIPTNTEYKGNFNSESNSESKSEEPPHPSFEMESVLRSVSDGKSRDPRMTNSDIEAAVYDREHSSPIQAAMRVCGVTDVENNRTFTNIAIWRDKNALFDAIEKFWGEIKAGEHDGLNNRAAELTRRLMAIPKNQA